MSDLNNERLAENLFDRLEKLEPVLNIHQYAEMQQDLLGLLVRGSFEEAAEAVIKWEQDYSGALADMETEQGLEALDESVQTILDAALAAKTQTDEIIIKL